MSVPTPPQHPSPDAVEAKLEEGAGRYVSCLMVKEENVAARTDLELILFTLLGRLRQSSSYCLYGWYPIVSRLLVDL